MRNSQNDIDDDKQLPRDQHVGDEAESSPGGYYYDDSTGYEVYEGEDETVEES